MRARLAIAAAMAAVACSGCLSVIRLGKLEDGKRRVWSEERQAYVTKTCRCDNADLLATFGLYPTMKMRWQLLRTSWHWAPKRNWWGQRVGVPVAELALLPGGVFDFVVDTISLPWDWKYRHNVGKDMCAGLDEERAYRSVCFRCGAKSDGEFARCQNWARPDAPDWHKFVGVCTNCIEAAKAAGYYFEGGGRYD